MRRAGLWWLVLTLWVIHVTLAARADASTAIGPELAAMAVQALAAAAALTRWRRSAGEARWMWLLLAVVVLLQMTWGAFNVLAGLATGETASVLGSLAVFSSALYLVPAMFLIARTFDAALPRAVRVLDALLSVCVIGILYLLIHHVLVAPPDEVKANIALLVHHADAVNLTLALLATVRLIGAETALRRHMYVCFTAFLWLNLIAAAVYNRLELSGLPWWAGTMLDVPFVVLAGLALVAPCRWLRHWRSSYRTIEIVDGFAPIVLSVGVLTLGFSISRLHFAAGLLVAIAAMLFYGMRVAFIQSRDHFLRDKVAISNRRLQEQLGIDPMTGIANRITLDARLPSLLEAARTSHSPCAVMMIDIDHFKQYNDHFGHLAGDTCLLQVVSAMRGALLRAGDLLARYGGEEFAVVLPDTTGRAAMKVAQRLVHAVAALDLAHPESPYGRVTVSIGVAACTNCNGAQSIEMLDAADRALYRVKRNGRNACSLLDMDDPESAYAQAPAADRDSEPLPG